ncbi:MAG: DUF262 domain-containing protein [Ardenticatenia bacterium]|nr:DUF262 domain-containing protein [Ardenticatenia bacterium]
MVTVSQQRPPVSANEEQISKIFSQSTYFEIPRFQRSYAWDVDEYSDFWEDISRADRNGGDHVHFLGAMVFARNPTRPSVYVLDGQQRLTTLMLLVAAMHKAVVGLDVDPEKLLTEDLAAALRVTVTIDGKAQRVRRLRANRQDRECFEQLVVDGKLKNPKHESHRLMKKAYDYLITQVGELGVGPLERYERIASLWATIRDRFWYIHIVCEEEINAQVVFESLNAKGEDLSTADLIKNYLFMEIEQNPGPDDIDEADKQWDRMINSLGKDALLPDYVHAYWGSKYAFSRAGEIYSELKDRISMKSSNVWEFLRQLSGEAETYAEIRNPSDDYWHSRATARMLREMKALNIRVTHGVLLALWAVLKSDPNDFERRVRMLLNFMVRYSKVAEKPTNTIHEAFSQWARDIRTGTRNPDEFDEWLRKTAPSPELFIESFRTWKIKSGPTARLILMKINNALNTEGEPEAMIADPEKVTLEHIIPQTPNQKWIEYLKANNIQLEDVVHRVGNLTLLTGPKNTAASNREFAYKRDNMYAGSSLPMNQDLVLSIPRDGAGVIDLGPLRRQLDEFGLAQLEDRQVRLAIVAESIWGLD